MAPGPAPPCSRWLLGAFLALLLFGTGLRLVHFVYSRSLWLDEAMLALNIAARPFGELLRPLDYNQVAPPLYLWIERLALVLAGVDERALRAFPMAAGLGVLALLWPVGRRLSGNAGALVAVTLAAFSPALIRYANEAKPYGPDALVALTVLCLALAVRDDPASRRRWAVLLAAGLLGILVSIPSAFSAAAVVLGLALTPHVRRHVKRLAACAGAWGTTVLLLYFFYYTGGANNPYQQQGYEAAFLVPGSGFVDRLHLALQGTLLPTFAGVGSAIPVLHDRWLWGLGAALLLGLAALVRSHGPAVGVLVAAPLAFAFLASGLRRYPVGVPRFMVFASPALALLAAQAAAWCAARLASRARPAFLAALGALAAAPAAWYRLQEARDPFRGEDARALVATWREKHGFLEPTYIAARGIPSWLFYTTNWEKPDRERLAFYARAASSGPSFENAPSRGHTIVDEGWDLVYETRSRREILGIATGRQWRWPSYVRPELDEGWGANEAARIASEARPCAWLYFTRLSERATRPLTWHLRTTHHAVLMFAFNAPGGVVYRFCLPQAPTRR